MDNTTQPNQPPQDPYGPPPQPIPPQDKQMMENNLPEQPKTHNKRAIISTILLFVAAPLIALTLTRYVIRSYEVDGPSMEQTLQNQDLLIVNKWPQTWSKISRKQHVPARHEIIIFDLDEGYGEKRQLVKRVIGLPGERVVVKNDQITVYNNDNPNGFNPDKDQSYARPELGSPGDVDVTVKEDEVFVVGDNRLNSLDSRYFGPVKINDIVGELTLRIFPINTLKTF